MTSNSNSASIVKCSCYVRKAALRSVHALLQRSNAQLFIDAYVQTRVKILFEGEFKMIL